MKEESFQINASAYLIHFGSLLEVPFSNFLNEKYHHSKKIIIVDENTSEHCLENLVANFSELSKAEVIVLPAGEENKDLEICQQVWSTLLEYRIGRNDVIINLGGGVVTDMGGFIASLYKRGIDFIQIPTSLLSMVDASVGGKTGVDLEHYKNVIGVFSNPTAVFIDASFLETLPEIDRVGGWMEMLKHGLIADANHWDEMKDFDFNRFEMTHEMIYHSVSIKNRIVQMDPFEKDERKKLNFGHTFGHALESYCLSQSQEINHGIAVGVGMVVESYWSWKYGQLSQNDFDSICDVIKAKVDLTLFQGLPAQELWGFMRNDKKNQVNKVHSVFLNKIGEAVIDCEISYEMLEDALEGVF